MDWLTKPPDDGVYDVPSQEYHKWDLAGRSQLKAFSDGEAAESVRWGMEHPEPSTPAMMFGTMAHTLMFEPEKYSRDVIIEPKAQNRKRIWQDDQWRIHVHADDEPVVRDLCGAVHEHPITQALFEYNLTTEKSLVWTDPETGLRCKARPDALLVTEEGEGVCPDLKTTGRPLWEFEDSVFRYGYNFQAAHYMSGMKVLGIPCDHWIFLVVKKVPKHMVRVLQLDRDAISIAENKLVEARKLMQQCYESGEWPGYSLELESISLPQWKLKQEGLV